MLSGSRSASSTRKIITAATALLLGLAMAGPAQAAELQVYPLRLSLDSKAPTGLLTVGNRGSDDALIQIAVFEWKQIDGRDQLTPTREVLVNPPVFQLKAAGQQIVRFGLRVPPVAVERSYRFTLQEVPPQQKPGFSGLNTMLKMSIPIFVPPISPSVALGWRIRENALGADIVMNNSGNVHVQIRSLKLVSNGQTLFDKAVNVYILPGIERAIPLELARPIPAGASVQLNADTDQHPFSLAITAEPAVNGQIRR